MAEPSRMPNYDVRNDGIGPYAVFYCETCDREHRSQPDVTSTLTKDIGRQSMGGLLRKVPLVGGVVADSVAGEDPRYTYSPSASGQSLGTGQKSIPRMPNLLANCVPVRL